MLFTAMFLAFSVEQNKASASIMPANLITDKTYVEYHCEPGAAALQIYNNITIMSTANIKSTYLSNESWVCFDLIEVQKRSDRGVIHFQSGNIYDR